MRKAASKQQATTQKDLLKVLVKINFSAKCDFVVIMDDETHLTLNGNG